LRLYKGTHPHPRPLVPRPQLPARRPTNPQKPARSLLLGVHYCLRYHTSRQTVQRARGRKQALWFILDQKVVRPWWCSVAHPRSVAPSTAITMAVVLNSDDGSYFGQGSLQRSHSQTHFGGGSRSSYQASTSKITQSYRPSISDSYSDSVSSSTSSSPRTTHAETSDLSYASTPASNFSFASDFEDTLASDHVQHGQFQLPDYKHQHSLYIRPPASPDDNLEPPPSPKTGDSFTPSPVDYGSVGDETPKPDTPEFPEHAEDDTAVTTRPSRQVDYLSHEWREEDIWSSWRYIVSRRGEYPNSERLENASWRTWMKSKNNLRTISPETLNWLKECDVTWLYGPLQPGQFQLANSKPGTPGFPLSKSGSFVNMDKKPILKKRSMSEVMLQRSLSTASLLKQATAAVQAQETKGILRPSLSRSNTDYVTYPFSSRRMSHGQSSVVASTESSGITSPSVERKHIHFNEQVEQCIALEVKGEDEDDVELDRQDDESDSDGVMMKRTRSKKSAALFKKKRSQKRAASSEGKTIAMLPSTTLKYREDSPELETAMKHSRSPHISPSSSQETLRPSAGRFFIGDDDDTTDAFCDPNAGWGSPPPELSSGLHRSASSGSLTDEPEGMRRTPSGMFMPYEEGQGANGEGIFGRVIDTVNTARDIAHVIWNVGWRK